MEHLAPQPEPEPSPFHEGELEAQARARVPERGLRVGRGIRPYLPDQHREFFALLPFVVLGARDRGGQPWASIMVGQPGFVSSPDETHVGIPSAHLPGDPLEGSLVAGTPVGLLGIELHTRRRNRANGVVVRADSDSVDLAIAQSFGNCPRYIHRRELRFVDAGARSAERHDAERLDRRSAAMVAAANIFFIATASAGAAGNWTDGADVSHRGGAPGFVRIDDPATLTVPDFAGNLFFNTIGNILRLPKAGLLFPDFTTGDMLYAAAAAEVIWDGPEIQAFAGAERLIRFRLLRTRLVPGSLPLRQ